MSEFNAVVHLSDGSMIVKHFTSATSADRYADHVIKHGAEFAENNDVTTFYPISQIRKVVVSPNE